MNRKSEICTRLRELRSQRGYTQREVADHMGVEVSAYAHYEKGDRIPDVDKLAKLAELYGLDDEMLGTRTAVDTSVTYDLDDLQKLKDALDRCVWVKGDCWHNQLQFEYLSERFRPVFKDRIKALPLKDSESAKIGSDQNIVKVRLDIAGEMLISRYINEIEKYCMMEAGDIMATKQKTEERAVGVLQSLVNAHDTMRSEIKQHDKEASWDGYIRLLFDGETESEKKNYNADIPIQIKGHTDVNNETTGKVRIKSSVDIDDLKVYFRNHGCLYFQTFLSEDGKDYSIFYNSLYPSKIKSYLDYALKKGNKKTITVPFTRLEATPKALEMLCRQFDWESTYQGSGRGQIVGKMIYESDFNRVKDIRLTVIEARNPYDVLERILSGDVVVYGRYEDGDIDFPIGWGDKYSASCKRVFNEPICIDGRKYYDKYTLEHYASAPGDKDYTGTVRNRIYVSPNLYLEFFESESVYKFSPVSDLMQVCWDAEFILDIARNNCVTVGVEDITYNRVDISDDFRKKLEGLTEVGKALRNIGCRVMISFKDLTKHDKEDLDKLVNIKKGNIGFDTKEEIFPYIWEFRNKIFPFIVEKGKRVQLREYMFSRTTKISLGSPAEDRGEKLKTLPSDAYIVPLFYGFTAEQFAKLYYIDYESMFEQVEQAVINDKTEAVLNGLSLNLIGAYDICSDHRLLEVAGLLLERLVDAYRNFVNLQINLFQTEKRRNGRLSEKSTDMLMNMLCELESEDDTKKDAQTINVLRFCTAVLLDRRDEAKSSYDGLSLDEKRMVDGLPIMTLYVKMVKD